MYLNCDKACRAVFIHCNLKPIDSDNYSTVLHIDYIYVNPSSEVFLNVVILKAKTDEKKIKAFNVDYFQLIVQNH